MYIHPFDPIVDANSQILILGSFPSLVSFEKSFYYAHPRNQFWKLLADVFQTPLETLQQKRDLCKNKKIALWDVVQSCQRNNSSDANLKNIEVNDFVSFLKAYPSINRIYFTGKKAEKLFENAFKDLAIQRECLPSPSPANATMSYEKKLRVYTKILKKGSAF